MSYEDYDTPDPWWVMPLVILLVLGLVGYSVVKTLAYIAT